MTQILYACGAIPFVMTNVPQALMVCKNPHMLYISASNMSLS